MTAERRDREHATSLPRLASPLTGGRARVEDIVHDAFVALHRRGLFPGVRLVDAAPLAPGGSS